MKKKRVPVGTLSFSAPANGIRCKPIVVANGSVDLVLELDAVESSFQVFEFCFKWQESLPRCNQFIEIHQGRLGVAFH